MDYERLEERREKAQHPNQFCNRILIQYRYQGSDVAILRLRPMIGDRDFHHQQQASQICTFHNCSGKKKLQAIQGNWGHPGNCADGNDYQQTKFGTGIITCRRKPEDTGRFI